MATLSPAILQTFPRFALFTWLAYLPDFPNFPRSIIITFLRGRWLTFNRRFLLPIITLLFVPWWTFWALWALHTLRTRRAISPVRAIRPIRPIQWLPLLRLRRKVPAGTVS
jgi:hypothetical protein